MLKSKYGVIRAVAIHRKIFSGITPGKIYKNSDARLKIFEVASWHPPVYLKFLSPRTQIETSCDADQAC
ncbi:hypothetical protein A1353_22560 [Methylomonas methanica]|jgi:hypothetical protein|uniref:Uncharacterized protein n=1 Tax=Methylomonas methanica TaxID=421 RepID=A0A177LY15_METMH|nr:hypothetical protein A1353_22560 [Methylomonas methanica]